MWRARRTGLDSPVSTKTMKKDTSAVSFLLIVEGCEPVARLVRPIRIPHNLLAACSECNARRGAVQLFPPSGKGNVGSEYREGLLPDPQG